MGQAPTKIANALIHAVAREEFSRNLLYSFLQYSVFPFLFVVVYGLVYLGVAYGFSLYFTAFFVSPLALAYIYLLECYMPYKRDWNLSQHDLPSDLTGFLVYVAVLEPLEKALIPLAGAALAATVVKSGITPHAIELLNTGNLFVDVVFIAIVVEFFRYWFHRLYHSVPFLWRVHIMHHIPKRLHMLNNFRVSPFEQFSVLMAGMVPAAMLGATEEAFIYYGLLHMILGLFNHANIDNRYGILNYVFATNELHRWHHTTDSAIGEKNFMFVLSLWDIIFGTFYFPKNKSTPDSVGLFKEVNYPLTGYFTQTLAPFRRS